MPRFFRDSSVWKVVEREKLPHIESNPRWINVFDDMLQGQKRVRIDKIIVFGRFWAEITLMRTFFSSSSVGEVVEPENLPPMESIGNMLSMLLMVKKHRKDY